MLVFILMFFVTFKVLFYFTLLPVASEVFCFFISKSLTSPILPLSAEESKRLEFLVPEATLQASAISRLPLKSVFVAEVCRNREGYMSAVWIVNI